MSWDGRGPSPEMVRKAQVAWLRTMRWDWWATLAFAHAYQPTAMLRAVAAWLQPLGPQAYAAIGVQRGPQGNRLHVHTVVGGVGRHPLRETLLRETWRRGSIVLVGYSPLRGAIEYMVRQSDEIELLGHPVIYRPRR